MKRLSASLEELSGRVKVLEDSATASFEADRTTLEKRRQEIDEAFESDAGKVESAVHEAAAAGRTWWDETRASMRRPLDDVRARYEKRQSEHEVHKAARVADAAEEDAAASIELAAYFLSVAEYAVIDAALARLAADELAGAPTGAEPTGATS